MWHAQTGHVEFQYARFPVIRLTIQVEFAGENTMRHRRKSCGALGNIFLC